MSIFIKIRNILIIIKIFYWLAFKASILSFWHRGLFILSHKYWAILTFKYFKVKLFQITNSEKMHQGKFLLLSNHRSQADFFIHNVITEYNCNILSRMLVGVVFFIFGICGNDTVWFFNRDAHVSPDKFNEWMDKKFTKSSRRALLAYPEGHRMAGANSVSRDKIKTGMIKYGYRRNMPVQLLMSFGNQNVFNEKKIDMNWNQSVYYSFSKVFYPSDFEDEKKFIEKIKDQFVSFFDEIYLKYENKEGIEIDTEPKLII